MIYKLQISEALSQRKETIWKERPKRLLASDVRLEDLRWFSSAAST